jgi:hypothetical protein
MGKIEDHPGYLGLTSEGVALIHADWPMYPVEHGAEIALASLISFPKGTSFEPIDDIDKCVLFVAKGYGPDSQPFDAQAFHVAIWHEDLLQLADSGFLQGLKRGTSRDHEVRKRNALRKTLGRAHGPENVDPLDELEFLSGGTRIAVSLPHLDEFDDSYSDWPVFAGPEEVQVTDAGWQRAEEVMSEFLEVPEFARDRMSPLIDNKLYDTALREVSALIESRMRQFTESELWGQKLVELFMKRLEENGYYVGAGLKTLRGELRTAFKFIRNDFAHQVVQLPRPRALALLGRMCRLLAEIEALVSEKTR